MAGKKKQEEEGPVMGRDPLTENDSILATQFFNTPAGQVPKPAEGAWDDAPARPRTRSTKRRSGRAKAAAPSHYKIVSISLYNDDINKIDDLVKELKKRGFTRANRSALIRYAIDTVDIDKMPRGY